MSTAAFIVYIIGTILFGAILLGSMYFVSHNRGEHDE